MFIQEITVQPGRTSFLANIFFQETGASPFAPQERGFADMDFDETTLTAYYHRQGAAAPVAIPLVTMTAGTWASGGLVKLSDANMPGMCQIGIPDAALAIGASEWVDVVVSVATAAAASAILRIYLKCPNPIVVPLFIKPGSRNNIIPIPVQMAGGGPGLLAFTAADFTYKYQRLGEAAVAGACVAGTVNTFTSGGLTFVTNGRQAQFCLPDAAVLHGAANGLLNVLIESAKWDMTPVLLMISFARSLAI